MTNTDTNTELTDQYTECAQYVHIQRIELTDMCTVVHSLCTVGTQTMHRVCTDCAQPASQETPPSPHVKSGGDCPHLRASPTLSHHYGEVTIRVSSDWPSVEH